MSNDIKKDFVIIEGGVVTLEGHKGPGDVISITEKEAKKMDPQGTHFMEKSKHDTLKRAEAAKQAELDKAAKAEAEKAAELAKKGGK